MGVRISLAPGAQFMGSLDRTEFPPITGCASPRRYPDFIQRSRNWGQWCEAGCVSPVEWIVITAAGLVVGFVGGYAGIGGAPFMIFALGALAGWPQHRAQGTVIAIMLGPMSLPAVWLMRDRVRRYLRPIAIGVVTYATFSYFGASLAYEFSSDELRLLFAGFLFIIALRSIILDGFLRGREDARGARPPLLSATSVPAFIVVGSLIGAVGGFFGVGAGVLLIPILTLAFGFGKDDARAISLAILLPPVSIGGVLKYQAMGDISWPAAAVGFLAYFASNYWGAKIGRRQKQGAFHIVYGFLLLVMGALYVIRTLD